MNSNAINICKRNIKTHGVEISILRPQENRFEEPDYQRLSEAFTFRGLVHTTTIKPNHSVDDSGTHKSSGSAVAILLEFDDVNQPKVNDLCRYNGKLYLVVGVSDIENLHELLDITLEVYGIVSV